jgi:hypothetical protein
MSKGVPFDELPAAVRAQLKAEARAPKASRSFTVERERQRAIELLAVVSDLSQSERGRVLRRALKLNEV